MAHEGPEQVNRSSYLPYLDGLRAISILLVMAHHAQGYFGQIGRTFHGNSGVDVFFVISGFLITSLLVQERNRYGTFSFKRFYMRRFLRLMPVYYTFILVMAWRGGWGSLPGVAICAVYLSNYDLALGWNIGRDYGLGITWSLAVEEQFYLFWPITLFLTGPRALRVAGLFILLVPIWRGFLFLYDTHAYRLAGLEQVQIDALLADRLYNAFDTRLDSLMIGCAIALLWADPQGRERIKTGLAGSWTPALLAVALFCSLQAVDSPWEGKLYYWSFYLTLQSLLIAVFILALLVHPQSAVARGLSNPVLMWIGRLSYSLYLWHWLAYHLAKDTLAPYLAGHWPGGALWERSSAVDGIGVGLSFVMASMSYYLVEKPFLRFKKYFDSKPAPIVPPPTEATPEIVVRPAGP